jgi:hypothetical protein
MSILFAIAYVLLLVLSVVRWVRWRRVVRANGAFRCRIRLFTGRCANWRFLRRRWSRRLVWARWVDGDLLVWRHRLLMRSVRLRARVHLDGVYRPSDPDVRGCGYRPVAVVFDISDGSRIEVVTTESARADLVGPYLGAALNDLPQAPRPRRQIRGPGS